MGSDQQHQDQAGQCRFDEPAGLKFDFLRLIAIQQNSERQKIKNRTAEPKHQHEPEDECQVPAPWGLDQFWINPIGCQRHRRKIGEQVDQQNL